MIKEIELVIFDMDGLMFDSESISFDSWNRSFSKHGYTLSIDVFKQTLGATREKTKEIFIELYGEKFPFEDIIDLRNNISRRMIKDDGVPIKKGLIELLNLLENKNVKVAVATSASRNRAKMFLEKSNVIGYFDYILCGDEVEKSKPNPEIFMKVCDYLSCNPRKTIVLEDSEAGIEAAYNANMLPVMVPDLIEPTKSVENMIYKKYNDLNEVIQLFKE